MVKYGSSYETNHLPFCCLKFHVVYQNLIFSVYIFLPVLSMFLEQIIILYQSHLTPMIWVEHALALLYLWKNGVSNVLINS